MRRTDVPHNLAEAYRCDICGCRHWTGLWRGHGFIHICRKCALKILPALLADATYRADLRICDYLKDVKDFLAAYWYALAVNLDRGKR